MTDNNADKSKNTTPTVNTGIKSMFQSELSGTEYTNWSQYPTWNYNANTAYPTTWGVGANTAYTGYPGYTYPNPYQYNNYMYAYNNYNYAGVQANTGTTATTSPTATPNTASVSPTSTSATATTTNSAYYNYNAVPPPSSQTTKPMYTSVSKTKQPPLNPNNMHAVPPPPSLTKNTNTSSNYVPYHQYTSTATSNTTTTTTTVSTNNNNKSVTTPNPMDTNQWPPKLRAYVERSFGQCKTDNDRSFIEAQLKIKITSAIANTQLWDIDWDLQLLPQLPLLDSIKQMPGKKRKTQNEFVQDVGKKQQREKRFQNNTSSNTNPSPKSFSSYNSSTTGNSLSSFGEDKEEIDWDSLTIKGTSQELEKEYLRLTSAPDPSTVRPEPVLNKSLKMLLNKWKTSPDYLYTCEQFKSIRQDLTVQGIKNEFTVLVYETHARLALENNDLGEFNQCQTVLRDLYAGGISGNQMEFLAYRLLYFIYQNSYSDISSLLAQLTPIAKRDFAVQHALQVREAITFNNYNKLFKLQQITPNKGGYLVDKCVDNMRNMALKIILKAYKPTLVPVSFLQNELGFATFDNFSKFTHKYNFTFLKDPETGEQVVDTKSVNV